MYRRFVTKSKVEVSDGRSANIWGNLVREKLLSGRGGTLSSSIILS